MTTPENRLQALEAHVMALTQLVLHLTASAEMQGAIDQEALCRVLSKQRWPNSPLDYQARLELKELLTQLDAAQAVRQGRAPQ